jgi:predicted dienelactone hydrolase
MRIFEILTMASLLLTFIGYLLPRSKRPRWMAFLPGLALLLVLLHLITEGCRWQMVPAYALTALTFLATVRDIMSGADAQAKTPSRGRRALGVVAIISGLLVLAIAVALSVLFPVFRLPEPTGEYAIGVRDLYFTDKGRPETFTPDPNDYREVAAQVWYPAELNDGETPRRYMEPDATRRLAFFGSWSRFLLSYLPLVRTHSYPNAAFGQSNQPFPVLLFNHADSAWTTVNTVLMEELASHGYVVVSVGHAYDSAFFVKPGGVIEAFDPQNVKYRLRMQEAFGPRVESIKSRITSARTPREQATQYRHLVQHAPRNQESVRTWAADVSFVMDQLEEMNQDGGAFAGQLDLERIGVLGHSFGGAASGQVCVTDERCSAGINMDGFQYGDMIERGLTKPFMFMTSDWPTLDEDNLINVFYERSESSAYWVFIKGSTHDFLTDIAVWGGLWGEAGGETDGTRCLRIVSRYALAFFDRHLKGEDNPLLDGPSSDYPEVVFSSRHP